MTRYDDNDQPIYDDYGQDELSEYKNYRDSEHEITRLLTKEDEITLSDYCF